MIVVKIEENIDNNNVLNLKTKYEIRISNNDICTNIKRKHHYNINLSDIENNFYINNGDPVTGIFKNITFYSGTFFDCTLFKNVIFENCNFNNISIRWCEFKRCQFINCKGDIVYIRATTFKKDCLFKNSNIGIKDIDEYMYFNAKRYGELEELK